MTDPTPREVETACFCPGGPHQRDHFVLPAELPVEAGIAAIGVIARLETTGADPGAALIGAILRNGGISSWNLVDAEGETLPLTPANVAKRVTWQKGGVEVSTALYQQFVNGKDLTPFGLTGSAKPTDDSSPNGQTEPSTSPKTRSSPKPRTPSA